MKKISLITLVVMLSLSIQAQTKTFKAKYNFSAAAGLSIEQIELTDTSTILSFAFESFPGNGFWIPDMSYICDVNTQEKKFAIGAEGIKLNGGGSVPESGVARYKLIFPKMDESTSKIDFGEGNDGGNWFIYDISLNPEENNSPLPAHLLGNWLNQMKGNLIICFFDKEVYYKDQKWEYGQVALKNGKGTIELINDNCKLNLLVKEKKGSFSIGETKDLLIPICQSDSEVQHWDFGENANAYTEIEFSTDSAVYSGYITNFSPRYGSEDLTIYVNNTFIGNQEEFSGKLDKKGHFSVKLPILHPQDVLVRSNVYNGNVFLEPGKELIQIIGSGKSTFMGEMGSINRDIKKLGHFNSLSYETRINKILNMSIEAYIDLQQTHMDKNLKKLDSLAVVLHVSPKAKQISELGIKYGYTSSKFDYEWIYEDAYRQKHNIPREQRELGIDIPSYKPENYQFVNDALINNPVALVSINYDTFINGLKYADITRSRYYSNPTIYEIAQILKERDITITNEEQSLIDKLNKVKDASTELDEFYLQERHMELFRKNSIEWNAAWEKHGKDADIALVIEELKNTPKLSDEDKKYLDKWLQLVKREDIKEAIQTKKYLADQIKAFENNHKDIYEAYKIKKRISNVTTSLHNVLNLEYGLATDLMAAQDLCGQIISEYSPFSEQYLDFLTEGITTPFIINYINNTSLNF